MRTFQERVNEKIGPKGYDPGMRRSVQSAIMFEAQRCVQDKLESMRPFQRKIAFFDQLVGLLESLDFIPPHYRLEIMWRTATSKEAMSPEIAWKRSRLIERELSKLEDGIKPHLAGKSHDEACEAMVQEMYESVAKEQAKASGDSDDGKVKARPAHWEHAHNNVMMTFRLYYDKLDPFPAPVPPVPIVVPTERPAAMKERGHFIYPNAGGVAALSNPAPAQMAGAAVHVPASSSAQAPMVAASPAEKRQRTLKEVRDHLELLKEFEGIIPAEEINKRKRELFLALPPAPPPVSAPKRGKL